MLLINETTLTYKVQFGIKNPELYLSLVSISWNIQQTNNHTHSYWIQVKQTLQTKFKQSGLFQSSYELLNMQNYLKILKFL